MSVASTKHLTTRRRLRTAVVLASLITCVAAGAISGPQSASAATTRGEAGFISKAQIDHLRHDLQTSPLPKSGKVIDGEVFEQFELPGGSMVGVPDRAPRLSAGSEGGTIYIQLNKTDQQALLNGGAAALAAALCAIPAVGWLACGGIVTALAIGMTYVRAHGICNGSKPYLRTLLNVSHTSRCVA